MNSNLEYPECCETCPSRHARSDQADCWCCKKLRDFKEKKENLQAKSANACDISSDDIATQQDAAERLGQSIKRTDFRRWRKVPNVGKFNIKKHFVSVESTDKLENSHVAALSHISELTRYERVKLCGEKMPDNLKKLDVILDNDNGMIYIPFCTLEAAKILGVEEIQHYIVPDFTLVKEKSQKEITSK